MISCNNIMLSKIFVLFIYLLLLFFFMSYDLSLKSQKIPFIYFIHSSRVSHFFYTFLVFEPLSLPQMNSAIRTKNILWILFLNLVYIHFTLCEFLLKVPLRVFSCSFFKHFTSNTYGFVSHDYVFPMWQPTSVIANCFYKRCVLFQIHLTGVWIHVFVIHIMTQSNRGILNQINIFKKRPTLHLPCCPPIRLTLYLMTIWHNYNITYNLNCSVNALVNTFKKKKKKTDTFDQIYKGEKVFKTIS